MKLKRGAKWVAVFLTVWALVSLLRLRRFYQVVDRMTKEPLEYAEQKLPPEERARIRQELARLKRSTVPKVIVFYPFFAEERRRIEAAFGLVIFSPLWTHRDYEIWLRGVTSHSKADLAVLETWQANAWDREKRGQLHAP